MNNAIANIATTQSAARQKYYATMNSKVPAKLARIKDNEIATAVALLFDGLEMIQRPAAADLADIDFGASLM